MAPIRAVIKNGQDKLVVLNKTAKAVIDCQRNNGSAYVFAHQHEGTLRSYYSMNTNGWKRARVRVGLSGVRVHDLRHTFGRRLRAAGVSYEDRQDLLGHKSGRITTHYSAAELHNLIEAANKVCDRSRQGPVLTLLRVNREVSYTNARKMPTTENFVEKYQVL